MAQYTQLTKKEIEEIAAHYELAVSSFESIVGGAENSSYLLSTSQGRMVLTIFEQQTMESAQPLGRLLVYLEEQSFRSTRVLARADGALISSHQGKPVMLKHYIEGQVHLELSEDMLHQVGVRLAQLHAIPAPDYLASEPSFGMRRISRAPQENFEPQFADWLARRAAALTATIPRDLPRGLIHTDLFADNLIFEGERLLTIIDFEEACRYSLVFDIGEAIVGTCQMRGEIAWPKARALLAGYEAVRALEEAEWASLQAHIEYGALSTGYWRYWKYHIQQPTPQRAKKHLEMKAIAEQVAAIPADEFLAKVFEG